MAKHHSLAPFSKKHLRFYAVFAFFAAQAAPAAKAPSAPTPLAKNQTAGGPV